MSEPDDLEGIATWWDEAHPAPPAAAHPKNDPPGDKADSPPPKGGGSSSPPQALHVTFAEIGLLPLPYFPHDVWTLVMDRAASGRCAGGGSEADPSLLPPLFGPAKWSCCQCGLLAST